MNTKYSKECKRELNELIKILIQATNEIEKLSKDLDHETAFESPLYDLVEGLDSIKWLIKENTIIFIENKKE